MSDAETERDYLAEARQSRELAMAMAEISNLTASATASLRSLDQPVYAPDDSNPSSTLTVDSPTFSNNDDKDFEYPDMSKYYSGSDYAASLPSVSSNYSSGFSNIFGGSGKESPRDNEPDTSKLIRRKDYGLSSSNTSSSSSGGGSVMKKVYVGLVVAFIALLLIDVSQQQMQNNFGMTSTQGVLITGTRDRNMSFHNHGAKLPKVMPKSDEPLQRVMVIGRHGASPGKFDQPRALAMVRKRFLFVSDFGNKRIQMMLFHGAPEAKEEQSSGEVVESKEVLEYALEMDQVGGPLAMCSIGDFVIIAEWGMHRLKIIKIESKSGKLVPVGFFGEFGYADETGKLNHPRGLAVQISTGFVVVSDENDHLQVLKFSESPSPALTFVSSFGRPSKAKGGKNEALGFFRRPSGIAIHDESGLVFVTDSKNHRIQTLRLTADGHLQPVSKFGAGGGFTFVNEPSGISLHPTHPLLMVVEEQSQCLHEIMINPGGHLSLRRSHCGKICSSMVTGSGLRVSGSRAAGPTSVLLLGDLVFITVADQVSLLKWTDWSME